MNNVKSFFQFITELNWDDIDDFGNDNTIQYYTLKDVEDSFFSTKNYKSLKYYVKIINKKFKKEFKDKYSCDIEGLKNLVEMLYNNSKELSINELDMFLCFKAKSKFEIPNAISLLSKLTHFYLMDNELEIDNIPKEFSTLTNIQAITILNYKGDNIDFVKDLSKLKSLVLSNCTNINEMPAYLFKLSKLNYISLYDSNIKSIPKEIKNLKNINSLMMYNGNLTLIEDSILNLTSLKELNLSHNNIIEVPKDIKNLSNLTDLSLSNNKITALPSELFELDKLKHLDISKTKIIEFPNSAKNSNLKTVYISNDMKIKNIQSFLPDGCNIIKNK